MTGSYKRTQTAVHELEPKTHDPSKLYGRGVTHPNTEFGVLRADSGVVKLKTGDS